MKKTHITNAMVPTGADAFVLAQLSEESGRSLLFVAPSDREMERVAEQLAFYSPKAEILTFPAWDCLPYDRVSPKQLIMAQRLSALSRLQMADGGKRRVVVVTLNALLQKLPPKSTLSHSSLHVKSGETLNRDALLIYLMANGYRRVGKCMEPGEFALRGNIIDLFPSGYEQGCRIDLFGDDVESIRAFDPLSQRSGDQELGEIALHPVSEVLLTEATITRFRSRYRELAGAANKDDPLYEAISSSQNYPGMEHWLPLFYDRLDTLYDYLPKEVLTVFSERSDLARQDREDLVKDYYEARLQFRSKDSPYHPVPPEELFSFGTEWVKLMGGVDTVEFTPFSQHEGVTEANVKQGFSRARDFAAERKQGKNPFEELAEYLRLQWRQGKATALLCLSSGSRQRMMEKLEPLGIPCAKLGDGAGLGRLKADKLALGILNLQHGFIGEKLAVLSEQDVLGERHTQSQRKRKNSERFLAEAANFGEGELVVHREHGIGRYAGLVTMEVQGISRDCLKLVYADEDKLFLPVENIDLISRYGSGEDEQSETRLDKLGAASWQNRKARMKERIKMAAEELLKAAALRELAEAPVLTPSEGLYEEFCRRFAFVETEDQEKAIEDVLADLARGRPADRLICGDVGFGKTEVAMRAAFVAATAAEGGVQVAIIAPTTLLARQHTRNFAERFKEFPLTVRQLSRLVNAKDTKETLEGLERGTVDVVIGTHALLAGRVKFKNLGLLVVDEEQHFGVKQKEKLKNLRNNVHVFTLSATPIPRTMQLALSGVRELSLITTPPVDRLAVRTFVSPYDPVMVREALLREYHRGGQSFYVTPRIADIAELRQRLRELAPDLKTIVAHGQMAAGELDQLMNDFYDGKFDVLLSTAIIESGLDIPTANTMIINRADRFGLSQLYQLRGRVGRGKTRAYAYLTLPHNKQFSATAMKRLEVMQTLDTLGAGFSVASHDMDIRGFGNLVGEEQSGHIREVGVELYQQMLEEAVSEARRRQRGEKVEVGESEWRPQINLGVSVLIPEDYISDLDLRLGMYRRAAALQSREEIEEFSLELADRFGPLPEEVTQFLTVMELKLRCQQAGIERLDAGPKGIVLSFRHNQFSQPEKLLDFITRYQHLAKLRADHKLVLHYPARFENNKEGFINRMVGELGKAAEPEQKAA